MRAPLPVRVLRAVRWCDTGAGATQLAFTLSHHHHLYAEQGVQGTAGIAVIDTTFLGTAAPSPPRTMMAPGEPAVDRACGGAGATGGTTTSLFSSLSSFSTSLHHDSPGAPRRRSGSIPALRLNCCCWLLGQGDGPVLCGLDCDVSGDRRAERRRATWLGLPFWCFWAAWRGGACDELEVGHRVSSPRGLREAEDMCRPVVQPPSFLHPHPPSLPLLSSSCRLAPCSLKRLVTPTRAFHLHALLPCPLTIAASFRYDYGTSRGSLVARRIMGNDERARRSYIEL